MYFEIQLLSEPLADHLDCCILAVLLNGNVRTCRQILGPGKLPSPDNLLIAVFAEGGSDVDGCLVLLHDIIPRVGNGGFSIREHLTGKGVIGRLPVHDPQTFPLGKFSDQVIEQKALKVWLIGLV